MSTVAFFSRRTCNFQGTMCARTLRVLKTLIQHRSFCVQLFPVKFTLFSIRWHFFNVKGDSKNRTKPKTPPSKQKRKISANRLSVWRQNVTPNVRLDIGVCGIAVLVNFSCGISVILILNCVIAVFSESAGWGISGVLVQRYLIQKKLFYTVSDTFLVWLVSDRLGNSGNKLKDVVVEKCWRAYATPAIRKLFENLCLQSLALTKVSFNDFPLRYDSMGGSWNISFRYGWFWIRCHFPISIFLTLGKAGWYCVTKGNIFFFVLLSLFSRAFR